AQVVFNLAHHAFNADRWFSDHRFSHVEATTIDYRRISLPLAGECAADGATDVDRAFHRVPGLEGRSVRHGDRGSLHVPLEREVDALALDRAGQIGFTERL